MDEETGTEAQIDLPRVTQVMVKPETELASYSLWCAMSLLEDTYSDQVGMIKNNFIKKKGKSKQNKQTVSLLFYNVTCSQVPYYQPRPFLILPNKALPYAA